MKIHRFIGLFSFSAKTTIIDDGDTVHQIKNVLRLRPGEIIALCSSENEQEAQCKIVSYEGKKVLCIEYQAYGEMAVQEMKKAQH